MRSSVPKIVEVGRIRKGTMASTVDQKFNGAFVIRYKGRLLSVISSDGAGYDHVSVSIQGRCPTWDEMCFIKDQFFEPEETAIQYHPAKSEYINHHPFTLHLWRKQGESVDLPPAILI